MVEPLEKSLEGKKDICIITDGVLGSMPFETLINKEGNYLIEKYNIRYNKSLRLQKIIAQRGYPASRNTVIAFGVSEYERFNPEDGQYIVNAEKVAGLVSNSLNTHKSLRDIYRKIGFVEFNDLHESMDEVYAIGDIFPDAVVYLNNKATESNLKALSQNGTLANYKIVHISAHGISVPEIPKMSALVLFQGDNQEDGFLNMVEIADLKIKADFVSLSACETGLGKIYSGEGVVSLADPFLIAGANSLCVSLWQVDDESTAYFMTEVYKLVSQKNMSYAQAINEVKRRFISGEASPVWKAPFFWAPFVFYGE